MTFSDCVAYLRARLTADEGQTMAEYGVVLAVIAVVTVATFVLLSGGIQGTLTSVIADL